MGNIKYKKGESITFVLPYNQIVVGKYVSQSKDKIKIDFVSDTTSFFEPGIIDLHKKYLQPK